MLNTNKGTNIDVEEEKTKISDAKWLATKHEIEIVRTAYKDPHISAKDVAKMLTDATGEKMSPKQFNGYLARAGISKRPTSKQWLAANEEYVMDLYNNQGYTLRQLHVKLREEAIEAGARLNHTDINSFIKERTTAERRTLTAQHLVNQGYRDTIIKRYVNERMSVQKIADELTIEIGQPVSHSLVRTIVEKYMETQPKQPTLEEKLLALKPEILTYRHQGYAYPDIMTVLLEKHNLHVTAKTLVKHIPEIAEVNEEARTETTNKRYKETVNERYGVDHPSQLPATQEKYKQTSLERYGTDNYAKTDECKERIRVVSQEKYGTDNPSQRTLPPQAYTLLKDKDLFTAYLGRLAHDLFTLPSAAVVQQELGISNKTLYNYLDRYKLRHMIGTTISAMEADVCFFLNELGVEYVRNVRNLLTNRQEIDIYMEEFKFGIECNPAYTHNVDKETHYDVNKGVKKKDYHQKKSLNATNRGIQLMHIYDYEWYDEKKQPIIKALIAHRVGKIKKTYQAQDLKVCKVSAITARIFLERNHTEGYREAAVTYGLYNTQGDLLQLMSFNPKDSMRVYELVRFATLCNVSIVGGASKLFNTFLTINKPTHVVTFANLDKTYGTTFQDLGFAYTRLMEPTAIWVDPHTFETVGAMASTSNEAKTALKDKGYTRVYNAGSILYVYKGQRV